MKTKINLRSFSLIVSAILCFFQISAQTTSGSGLLLNNNSTPAAGSVGTTNTMLGSGAGNGAVTNGINNTFIGDHAGFSNTYAKENVAVGVNALYTQSYSNSSASWSSYNVAVGSGALYSNQPTSTANGISNTAIGYQSGYNNTTGSSNTFNGMYAGYSNTTGGNNVFFGYQAGYLNTTASTNSFLGYQAGYSNTTGIRGTFAGFQAGYSSTGNYNTFLGWKAGNGTTSGTQNTAVGESAGISNTTGSNNTFFGYGADLSGGSAWTNATAIGNGALTDSTNHFYLGNSSVSTAWSQVAWTVGSDRRVKNTIQENVHGLDFIKLLKPVTFHYDVDKENELMGWRTKEVFNGKYDIEKIQYSGFIAQEVDSAARKVGYNFSGVDKSSKVMSLRYDEFNVPLVKAVQEISKKVDLLKSQITAINKQNSQISSNPTISNPEAFQNNLRITLSNDNQIALYQNEPNPFDATTSIRYYIPENNVKTAFIVFHDQYGKEIKKVEILKWGNGKIDITSENLASGIYSYVLIVGGDIKDTKKMIKNK